LTIEEGTPFYTRHQRGEFVMPDDDAAGAMYEITQDMTAARGLMPYEISNHARFGDESRHNLAYWRYDDYVGVGPGAHGRLTLGGVKYATRAHRAPALWLQRVDRDGHGAHPQEKIDSRKQAQEMVMMGLRLAAGIDLGKFERQTGLRFSDFINPSGLTMMEEAGLITVTPDRIAATADGRQRLNAVLKKLLA
jgi:oxygen-independent coproporphyrinogen-3 oxidase